MAIAHNMAAAGADKAAEDYIALDYAAMLAYQAFTVSSAEADAAAAASAMAAARVARLRFKLIRAPAEAREAFDVSG